jgi:hypothetical protein
VGLALVVHQSSWGLAVLFNLVHLLFFLLLGHHQLGHLFIPVELDHILQKRGVLL